MENWGKEKLFEKQEERKKETVRQKQQAKQNEEQARNEKIQQEKERRQQAIEIFEALTSEEQEEILDIVQEQLSSFFKAKFIEARRKGEPAHLNIMANILIQKIFFDSRY